MKEDIMAEARPKLLRNLTRYTLRLRFGSKKDPYHVELQPRGLRGDVQSVPAAIAKHPTFDANLDRAFEVITPTVAKKLAEEYPSSAIPRHAAYDGLKVSLERDADNSRTVATYEQTTTAGKETLRRTTMEPARASVAGSEDSAPLMAGDESTAPTASNLPGTQSPHMPPFKGIERVKE